MKKKIKLEDDNKNEFYVALKLFEISSMTDDNVEDNHRKYSSLMVAAEAGKIDEVNNLISQGERVDFEINGESAVSLAYAGGHHDVVLALLKANSKFPRNLQAEMASDELKAFVDLSHKMHDRISQGDDDDEDLKNFLSLNIKANPNLNYFYDTQNFSLIMRAFEARKFKTLKLLWDLDLKLAPHEEIWSTFAKFSFNEKEKFIKLYMAVFDNFFELPDREVTDFKDFRGFNALMIAVEFNYIEEAKYCIEKGFFILDATFNGYTAACLAFSYRHYEILLMLLKANAEFPDNFDSNLESLTEELKIFVEVSNAIHNHIESNDAEKVEKIIKENSNLNFFYDPQNRSAFRHAIESKKFEIYKLLSKNFITFGSNENFSEMKKVLTQAERSELKRIQFELAEPLISQTGLTLVSHSFIGYDSKNKRREVVMEAFNFLLKHHRTKNILKVVATQKNYQIVFDFTANSVEFMDPNSGNYARGSFEFGGRIYIAAKKLFDEKEKFQVIGTLAHELCHFAMLITFKNKAKPYKVKDEIKMEEFDKIIAKLEKLWEAKEIKEEIIELVFEAYDSALWRAEMIVRPVQIDVQYNEREELSQKQENFRELYDFYDGHCMSEMEKILPELEAKANFTEKEIQKLRNFNFGLLVSIAFVIFLGTFVAFKLYNPTMKWNELSQEQQDIVKNSTVKFHGVDVKFDELFKNDSKVFELLSSEQIKGALRNETEELSKAIKDTFKPYIYITWSNMTERLKNKFLSMELDFQGQNVTLGKIMEIDSIKYNLKSYVYLTWSNMTKRLKNKFLKLEVHQGRSLNITLANIKIDSITRYPRINRILYRKVFKKTFNKILQEEPIKNGLILDLLNSTHIEEIFSNKSFKISTVNEKKVENFIERYFIDARFEILSEQLYLSGHPNRKKRQDYWVEHFALPIIIPKFFEFPPLPHYVQEIIRKSQEKQEEERRAKEKKIKMKKMFYKNGKINLKNPRVIGFHNITRTLTRTIPSRYGRSKIFLLSSAAGDGKSTIFSHFNRKFKKEFPYRWVQFVDLKKHIHALESGQKKIFQSVENISSFLGEECLLLNYFELEIFHKFFKTGNVIFLWDSIDEIAKFKDFMLDLTKNISRNENFQFISTRPQYAKEFKEKLNVKAHKLIPFSEFDRFEFIVKSIAAKKFNENGNEIFEKLKNFYNQKPEEYAEKFNDSNVSKYFKPISKVQKIFASIEGSNDENKDQDRFVSNPLLIWMTIENSCDEINSFRFENSSFNTFELYEIFVKNKLSLAHDKGELVKNEMIGVLANPKIWKVYQIFALKLIFATESETSSFLSFIDENVKGILKKFSFGEISRSGILQINSETDFNFIHRTFAEFFVAQYFLDDILMKNVLRYEWAIIKFYDIWFDGKASVVKSFLEDSFKFKECDFDKYWSHQMKLNQEVSNGTFILKRIQFIHFFGLNELDRTKGSLKKCFETFESIFRNLTAIKEIFGDNFLKVILKFKTIATYSPPFLCSIETDNDNYFLAYLGAAKRLFNKNEMATFLLESKGSHERNILALLAGKKSVKTLKYFLQFIQSFMSKDQMLELLRLENNFSWRALQHSAENGDPKVFKLLSEVYEKKFSSEEIKRSFLNTKNIRNLLPERYRKRKWSEYSMDNSCNFMDYTLNYGTFESGKRVIKYIQNLLRTKNLSEYGLNFVDPDENSDLYAYYQFSLSPKGSTPNAIIILRQFIKNFFTPKFLNKSNPIFRSHN